MKISLKRGCLKRLLCIALSVVLAAGFAPMKTNAAGWKYKCSVTTLSRGRTISAKEYYSIDVANRSYNYTYYKITVPENGYIKFKKSKAASKIYIYKTINRNNPAKETTAVKTISSGKKTNYCVLKRGTYYLGVYDATSLKWTFTRAGNPTNYCRAKAASLSRGKNKTVVFNYKYEYARWYKFKITTKKKITLYINDMADDLIYRTDVTVIDSDGYALDTPVNTLKKIQTYAQYPGTYYIRVTCDPDEWAGSMLQIKWK